MYMHSLKAATRMNKKISQRRIIARPLKICSVVFGRPDTTIGGTESCLWFLSRELVKLGCEVHVIYDRSLDPSNSHSMIKDGVYLQGVGGSSSIRPVNILSFAGGAFKKLTDIENNVKPDIYIFHGNYSLLPISRFKRLTKSPLVYHTYTALPAEAKRYLFKTFGWSLQYFIKRGSNYLFYTLVEYIGLKYIDCIIVSSPHAVKEFSEVYEYPNTKIYTWPTGGDQCTRFIEGLSIDEIEEKIPLPKGKRLLFVGNDWHRKGMKYLLQALAEVLQSIKNVFLIIIGSPQEPFMGMAKKLGILDHIILTGQFISDEQLAYYYAACDVFVLPSSHEGWSGTVTEATCFGKPVVATPIAALPVVEEGVNGLIVPPHDSKALAHALRKILTDDMLYQKLLKGAKRRSKLYSWKHTAEKTLETYGQIIDQYG